MCVCMCVCVCVCIYLYIDTYIYMYMYVYMCVCVCVCIHIYIYVYIYVCIYICIYVDMYIYPRHRARGVAKVRKSFLFLVISPNVLEIHDKRSIQDIRMHIQMHILAIKHATPTNTEYVPSRTSILNTEYTNIYWLYMLKKILDTNNHEILNLQTPAYLMLRMRVRVRVRVSSISLSHTHTRTRTHFKLRVYSTSHELCTKFVARRRLVE